MFFEYHNLLILLNLLIILRSRSGFQICCCNHLAQRLLIYILIASLSPCGRGLKPAPACIKQGVRGNLMAAILHRQTDRQTDRQTENYALTNLFYIFIKGAGLVVCPFVFKTLVLCPSAGSRGLFVFMNLFSPPFKRGIKGDYYEKKEVRGKRSNSERGKWRK